MNKFNHISLNAIWLNFYYSPRVDTQLVAAVTFSVEVKRGSDGIKVKIWVIGFEMPRPRRFTGTQRGLEVNPLRY